MVKNSSPDPPFISHYAIIQGELGLFLTFSVFELQKGYLYQNGVEFRQKVIGAGLNLFWGHLHYFSGGIWTFPLLSDTYASAPIAERAIFKCCCFLRMSIRCYSLKIISDKITYLSEIIEKFCCFLILLQQKVICNA